VVTRKGKGCSSKLSRRIGKDGQEEGNWGDVDKWETQTRSYAFFVGLLTKAPGRFHQRNHAVSSKTWPFLVTRFVTKCNGASVRVSFSAFQAFSCSCRISFRVAFRVSLSSLLASRAVFQASFRAASGVACRVSEFAVIEKSVGGCAMARHAAVFFS